MKVANLALVGGLFESIPVVIEELQAQDRRDRVGPVTFDRQILAEGLELLAAGDRPPCSRGLDLPAQVPG